MIAGSGRTLYHFDEKEVAEVMIRELTTDELRKLMYDIQLELAKRSDAVARALKARSRIANAPKKAPRIAADARNDRDGRLL